MSASSFSGETKTSKDSKREGQLQKKSKSFFKGGWRDKYFILSGGSLYYYEKFTDQAPQGVFQLQNCSLVPTDISEKKKFVIAIQTPEKAIYLAAKSSQEYDEWLMSLQQSMTSPATPPPDKLHKLKNKSKTTSNLVDKALDFSASRKIIKDFVTDDTFAIMEVLKSFVTKFDGGDTAEQLEILALQTGVKIALLFRDKKITRDMLWILIEPLHRLCDKIIDGYEIPFAFNSADIVVSLKDIWFPLERILKPHFNDKSLAAAAELIGYFQNEELLNDFFEKRKWKETAELGTLLRDMWDGGKI